MKYGLGLTSLDAVFVTHMHGDHVLGLPGLIESMGLLGREKKLYVGGPRGLREFLTESFKWTRFNPPFPLEFVDSLEVGGMSISSFPSCHTIDSLGYVVKEKDRVNLNVERLRETGVKDWRVFRLLKEGKSVEVKGVKLDPETYLTTRRGVKVVYTGDTMPCEQVIRAAEEADLLIHDSTFLDEKEAHSFGHSLARDAATTASKSHVKALALFHISARYRDASPLVQDARRFFPHCFLAEDVSFYDVRA